ncbi:MAG: riboflavin synthase [Ignavibacteria bacterium]|jgi:riboflavin synthase|nr:riboflavin synthase [Ignavibacteria bacterium]
MFTGIITSTGKVMKITMKGDSIHFLVKPLVKNYLRGRKKGDSMAINGACMTITKLMNSGFEFTTVKESLSKTNLGGLKTGSFVNLEKPMKLNASLDGHIVQGHVDTTGEVYKINKLKDSWEFYFKFPSEFRNNIIYVGSVSINGISLTVAEILKETGKYIIIKIAVIPHTYDVTNFRYLKPGDSVNLEFDMLGKFVMRILDNIRK